MDYLIDRWCVISGKQLVVCKSADSNAKRAVFELIGYQVTPTPHDDILNAREERHTFKVSYRNLVLILTFNADMIYFCVLVRSFVEEK